MNRKVLNFILTFIILITMIFGLIGAKNISFADVAEKPLYINLGKSKDNKGYAIKTPTEADGNYIWEINQYNSNNVNDKVTNPRNLYCINAE